MEILISENIMSVNASEFVKLRDRECSPVGIQVPCCEAIECARTVLGRIPFERSSWEVIHGDDNRVLRLIVGVIMLLEKWFEMRRHQIELLICTV